MESKFVKISQVTNTVNTDLTKMYNSGYLTVKTDYDENTDSNGEIVYFKSVSSIPQALQQNFNNPLPTTSTTRGVLNSRFLDNSKIKTSISAVATPPLPTSKGNTIQSTIASIQNPISEPLKIENSFFSYENFITTTHFEPKKEYKSLGGVDLKNIFKVEFKFNYNFLIRQFEEYIKDEPEVSIPQFYELLNEKILDNNLLKGIVGQSLFDNPKENFKLVPNAEINYPFIFPNKLPKEFSEAVGYENNSEFALKDYFKKLNPFKEQFPFYAEIRIDTHEYQKENTFNGIIHKNNLFSKIIDNHKNSGSLETNRVDTLAYLSFVSSVQTNLFQSIVDSTIKTPERVISAFRKVIKNRKLNLSQILENQQSYSEVIGYKITKYDIRAPNPTPIETWYVPNTNEGVIEIIDNRIKYSKYYGYRIDLLVMALTSDVTLFSKQKLDDISNSKNVYTSIEFKNVPKIKLYEVVSTAYANFLFDSPPIQPDVDLIPFVGVDNKIKINLSTAIGTKEETVITFTAQEAERIAKIKESQERKQDDLKITFSSEEPSDFFIMYKLDTPPASYKDFYSAEGLSIDKDNESSAGSMDLSIQPNKKYYLIFRSVDYHGNISNPTPVYQVELVNQNGLIYPDFQIYDFKDKSQFIEHSKKFRRYLYISPSFSQNVLNKDASKPELYDSEQMIKNNVVLGEGKEGIWDKKLKFRIKSTSTGRIMDINVIFTLNKD